MLHNILNRAHAAASIFDLQVSTTCCTAEAVMLRPCPRPAATPRRALDGWTTGGSSLRSAGPCRALLEDHVQRRGLPRSITTGGGRTSRCSTAPPASAPQPPPDNVARFAGVTGLLVSGVAAQPTRTSTVLRATVRQHPALLPSDARGAPRSSTLLRGTTSAGSTRPPRTACPLRRASFVSRVARSLRYNIGTTGATARSDGRRAQRDAGAAAVQRRASGHLA